MLQVHSAVVDGFVLLEKKLSELAPVSTEQLGLAIEARGNIPKHMLVSEIEIITHGGCRRHWSAVVAYFGELRHNAAKSIRQCMGDSGPIFHIFESKL